MNHNGFNNYYGGIFVHMYKFYYFGDTSDIVLDSNYMFSQPVGFIYQFDQQDTNLCSPSLQNYNFAAGSAVTIPMTLAVATNMNWVTTGITSGPAFALSTGRSIKPFTLTVGVFTMNLKEPIMNNTWCPIVTNPSPANILPPVITTQMLLFNPDLTVFPIQNVSFNPFTVSLACPDTVFYYSSFLSDTSQPLPSFIVFDPVDSVFMFTINQLSNVGTYQIML